MDQFKQLNEKIKEQLSSSGISKPTLIQRKAIPPLLENKNSLLIAPTGTGKTEAALFPVFSQLIDKDTKEGIKIIYIAPLRALNRDMLSRLKKWEEILDIDIQVRHGDTTQYQRRQQALDPPDMLITTPETLQAILPGSRMKEHLKKVNWCIVDEIHELAESKRGSQLTLALERLSRLSEDFQRIGLSATVGNPKRLSNFLAGTDREVEVINASTVEEMTVSVESPMPSEEDAGLSEELNAQPSMVARIQRIKELIENHQSTLTFVNTRESSETLGSRLKFLESDFPISVHHGSLARDLRISAEEDFRDGKLKSLICTSSMELGIDIGNIDFVIQYGSPRQVKRCIQRMGRSGHEIGRSSKGVIISTDPDDVMEAGIIAKGSMDQKIEPVKVHERALDALSNQIVGFLLDGVEEIDAIYEQVKRADPYKDLSKETFLSVVKQLQNQRLVWRDEDRISSGQRTWKYYYTNLSMIPDIRRYDIKDMVSGESIGTLDEEFVIGKMEVGTTFITKGEAWEVVEIEEEQIRVEPIDDPYGAIPAWEGELIPVTFKTADKVSELREKVRKLLNEDQTEEEIAEKLRKEYPTDKKSIKWAVSYLKKQKADAKIPKKDNLLIETYSNFSVIHAPFGTIVNRTLGQIISALLSTRLGTSVGFNHDPYRIAFRFPKKSDKEMVKETIKNIKPDHVKPIFRKIIDKSPLFRWKLLHTAKRFGAIDKDADFSEIQGKRLVESYKDTPIWEETEREIRLEKFNLERLEKIIKKLENGEMDIEEIKRGEKEGPTTLSLPILNELARKGELSLPEKAEREIIKALKRRLKNEQVKLFCLNCKEWSTLTRVRRLPEEPECGNCGAKLLATLPLHKRGVKKALEKQSRGLDLDEEEQEYARRARDSANLVITHGKKAILAMSGRGVGPSTASKILSMQYEDDEKFYRDILKAEREYARTHKFWD